MIESKQQEVSIMEQNFDKQRLSTLLWKAQGDRTREKFSQDAGISLTQVSKLVKGIADGPPRPITLRKIADIAQNGITYNDLMDACGYSSLKEQPEIKEHLKLLYRAAEALTEDEAKAVEQYVQFTISQRKKGE